MRAQWRRSAKATGAAGESASAPDGLGKPDLANYGDLSEIGRGGSSVVYRAWEARFKRWVVIKKIQIGTGGTSRSQFDRECGAIGALAGHPNIVSVYAAWLAQDGAAYIVMEYLPDGTLADHIRDHPLDWERAAAVGINLAGALESAHRSDILHLDVKPENVFLRRDYDTVKLGDFGIASIAGRTQTVQTLIAGTLLHIAPERLRDQPPTSAADVYSLGSTLFTILASVAPFGRADEAPAVVMARLLADERRPLVDLAEIGVPASFCRAVAQALSADPDQRPTAAELAAQLQLVQESQGLSPTPVMLTAVSERPLAAPAGHHRVSGQHTLPPRPTPVEIGSGDSQATDVLATPAGDDAQPASGGMAATESISTTIESHDATPEAAPGPGHGHGHGHGVEETSSPVAPRRQRSRTRIFGRMPVREVVVGVLLVSVGIAALRATPDSPRPPPEVPAEVTAMAVDPHSGGMYISDSTQNRVYRVSAAGKVDVVAGNGERGFDGDGAAATRAKLAGPAGLAVDGRGNLFIADQLNRRVRKVTPSGTISTAAGAGEEGYTTDGHPAAETRLDLPKAIGVNSEGVLFMAEAGSRLIRKVGADGRVTTVAGGGTTTIAEAVFGTDVRFGGFAGLTLDVPGNLFVTTLNHRLIRIALDGRFAIIAGTGTSGLSDDGSPAIEARLASPSGVAVNAAGEIFLADGANGRVRRIGADGRITTIAMGAAPAGAGGQAIATTAGPTAPRDLALDGRGNLFVLDAADGRILKVSRNGRVITAARSRTSSAPPATNVFAPGSTVLPPITTAPAEVLGVIFRDDFSQATTGWTARQTSAWTSEYADGGYRMAVRRNSSTRLPAPLDRVVFPAGPIPTGALTIETSVAFAAASPSVWAGITCRSGLSHSAGYRAHLRADGFWDIVRLGEAGTVERTLAAAKDRSEYVSTLGADGPNRLAFDCLGGTDPGPVSLALTVNGQRVGEVEDADGLGPGVIYLSVAAGTNAPTETTVVVFDDFVVTRHR